jgi:hypothetical protein
MKILIFTLIQISESFSVWKRDAYYDEILPLDENADDIVLYDPGFVDEK